MVTQSMAIYFPESTRWTRLALVDALRQRLKPLAQHVFLFGSHARGQANADSDIDIIIVAETKRRAPTRAFDFGDALRPLGAVDVIVYTPSEWDQMKASGHPFLASIQSDLIEVF